MSLTSLIFLTCLGFLGIIYFFIGITKKDYPLIICGFFLGFYSFFVKDFFWLSLLGLAFILAPFIISRNFIRFLSAKKEEKIMDPILLRRSIGKYVSKNVPQEIIEYLLEAAQSAPSAGGEAPWHLVVINSRSLLEKITEMPSQAQMLKEAPLAIVICCDLNLEKNKGFWIQDCSAATENILLAARTKGLGYCWLGVYPRQDRVGGLKKLLWLPENIVPFSIVVLGYTQEEKPYQKRYNAERIHYNGW